MAAPLLLGAAVLQSVGMLGGMFSAYGSARSQKIQLRHQAEMSRINAEIAELGARQELENGQSAIAKQTMQAGQLKSSQRAALGASGVDLGYGSAAELLTSTDLLKEIDMNQLEANALRSAWGYRTEAVNMRGQAAMADVNARSINPWMSAASSLLGGAGQVATSWYNYSRAQG